MNLITSSQNAVIKDVKSLKSRKAREDKELFYVEGSRIVDEALKDNADIIEVIVAEAFAIDPQNESMLSRMDLLNIKVYYIADKLFKELTDTETPQGILAVMKIKKTDPDNIAKNKGLFVILDSIRDPGNMGTIIRTADAAGFSGIIVSKGCVDVYNPKVLRSTMGSIFHIPIYQYDKTIDAIRFIKTKGYKVLASHLDGSVSVFDAKIGESAAIVIGSEAEGISEEAAAMADILVRIPMAGRAESLNASVAAGILMYEAVRQGLGK
jgi:rRNA methylases